MQAGDVVRWMQPMLTLATSLRLVPISIVLLAGVVLSIWTQRLLDGHEALLVRNHELIEVTKDMLIGIDDAETGQRGYLLSGDGRYLLPYARARDRLQRIGATLRSQMTGDAAQMARLDQLGTLVQSKMTELEAAIAAHDQQGFQAGVTAVLTSPGQALMDQIRHQIGQITHAEMALLAVRNNEVSADERRIEVVGIAVGVVSLLTRFLVEWYLSRVGRDPATHPGAGALPRSSPPPI